MQIDPILPHCHATARRSARGLLTFFRCSLPILSIAVLSTTRAATAPAAPEPTNAQKVKRVYVATRLTGTPPRTDGRLDEACWSSQGAWASDYTQFNPKHGAPATERTELKILYDDKYVYVGIRASDSRPDLQTIFAGPRDNVSGDAVGICFDSYFDQRTGYEFDLTSAGQKADLTVVDSNWDSTWNAVWDGKVFHDNTGWTAEMRIPLNQLRYHDGPAQVWGLHAWRRVARDNEESQWQLLSNDDSGTVNAFGELRGLELPRPRRHVELVPYVSGKYTSGEGESPRSKDSEFAGGLDAKLQLSSSITLDATVNPDFGQVEADPSEMNLTAFETFLSERRPFFLEGKSILQFELDDDEPLFYSRRIGRGPALGARDGAYDVPESTAILGAWKITGKTARGLSLGILHAVTAEEHAFFRDYDGLHRQTLEPAANYLVARAQQDLDHGNTVFGGMATLALRSPDSDALRNRLPRQSAVGGLDFQRYWNDRTYFFTARAVASRVTGEPGAIARLQTSSARYYQRPDADYLTFDPQRRSLDGWGGYVAAGKGSKGHWRVQEQLSAHSPGLEFNDLGFLRQADRVKQQTSIDYVEREPAAFYREFRVELDQQSEWNFGSEHLGSSTSLQASIDLKNRAYAETEFTYRTESLDLAALRGGPALKRPSALEYSAYYSTDGQRRWVGSLSYSAARSPGGTSSEQSFEATVKYRPIPALTFSLTAEKERQRDQRHFVPVRTTNGTSAYVVSDLRSDTLAYTFRAQWFVRPELSLQYYGSPFGSTGEYSGFEQIVAPRAGRYADRGRPLRPTRTEDTYYFDANGDGVTDFSTQRPDFSFAEFRSNLVLRWEFRPGSNFYAVWSQGRSDGRDESAAASTVMRRLSDAPATNVFLLKCSYWFSL